MDTLRFTFVVGPADRIAGVAFQTAHLRRSYWRDPRWIIGFIFCIGAGIVLVLSLSRLNRIAPGAASEWSGWLLGSILAFPIGFHLMQAAVRRRIQRFIAPRPTEETVEMAADESGLSFVAERSSWRAAWSEIAWFDENASHVFLRTVDHFVIVIRKESVRSDLAPALLFERLGQAVREHGAKTDNRVSGAAARA